MANDSVTRRSQVQAKPGLLLSKKPSASYLHSPLPTANAGQHTTWCCKPLLFWFPSQWQYINVQTSSLNLIIMPVLVVLTLCRNAQN